MLLEGLIHEVWVHGASQWALLQSWQVANTKVGGTGTYSPHKDKDEFTQGWIAGMQQLKLSRPSHPSTTGKQITPLLPFTGKSSGLKVDKQLFWIWDSQLSALWWCRGIQVLATGTGDSAVPSLLVARTQLWVSRKLDSGVHYPTFQQQLWASRTSWDVPSKKEGNGGQASNFPEHHPLVKMSVLRYFF